MPSSYDSKVRLVTTGIEESAPIEIDLRFCEPSKRVRFRRERLAWQHPFT